MKDGTTRITAEWALWAKPPGGLEDYAVLDNSTGMFDRDLFAEIISHFGSGSPETFPQVTISWVREGHHAHLGLAIQDLSGQVDRWRRQIAETRYFCVPYRQLCESAVTYGALYDAFHPRRLPSDGILSLSVPPLNAPDLAGRVDGRAMRAAALLLTGKNVCVVQGESLSLPERLRFLDTVAALLPYGLRAKFSASTWTSSATAHRIRLSFSRHARDDAGVVSWTEPSSAPWDGIAARYYSLLDGHPDKAELIAGLARDTEPLSFKEMRDCLHALDLLDNLCGARGTRRPPALEPPRPTELPTPEELLSAIADRLDRPRPASDLPEFVHELGEIAERLEPEERARSLGVIRKRNLYRERPELDPQLRSQLQDAVLRTGYGPLLTPEVIDEILRDAGGMTPQLFNAMRLIPPDCVLTNMIMASYAQEHSYKILEKVPSEGLIANAAREPYDERVVRIACREIGRRSADDEAEAPMIARALEEHDYLARAVCLLTEQGDRQLDCFHGLLTAAYRSVRSDDQFEEVIGHPAVLSCQPLFAAAVLQYGHGAGDRVVPAIAKAMATSSGLSRDRRKQIQALLRSTDVENGPTGRSLSPPRSFGSVSAPRGSRWIDRLTESSRRYRARHRSAIPPLALVPITLVVTAVIAIVVFFLRSGQPAADPHRPPASPVRQTQQEPAKSAPPEQQVPPGGERGAPTGDHGKDREQPPHP
ncbi:hypothetical protein [Actinomadura sp. DC4]|uniref:hypothetical protein n=1 Tax=Actinomadura sp. DC4 TaxID=3055069 RepID=UPI0025B0752D|nr:hypothetical protein [Actinomadura sp. DC4]MDN3351447.1 hypothetical protein [Actinomadura sp. DC4]